MAQQIRDIMTDSPVTLGSDTTVAQAAEQMRRNGTGDVLVVDGSTLRGIVTDRDIVVRVLAEQRDPARTTLGEICSGELATVRPDDDVARAIEIVRDRAVRRIPVVDNGRPVGIVSIGDLALERDPDSALADVSAAPTNV